MGSFALLVNLPLRSAQVGSVVGCLDDSLKIYRQRNQPKRLPMRKMNSVEPKSGACRRAGSLPVIEMERKLENCPAPWACQEGCYSHRSRCQQKQQDACCREPRLQLMLTSDRYFALCHSCLSFVADLNLRGNGGDGR